MAFQQLLFDQKEYCSIVIENVCLIKIYPTASSEDCKYMHNFISAG